MGMVEQGYGRVFPLKIEKSEKKRKKNGFLSA